MEKTSFEQTIELIVSQLKNNSKIDNEWLRTLHTNYTQRFLADNERIWSTGAIMIPLSLAAFAVLPAIQNPCLLDLSILALVSSTIIVSWIFFAENHRAFQQKSLAWISAIERVIEIRDSGPPKIVGNSFNRVMTFGAAIQLMRVLLTVSILFSWVLILIFWHKCA